MRLVIALVAAALLATAQSPVAAGSGNGQAAPESNAYTLGPGDRIDLRVFGHDDISGEYQVDGSGAISVPLAGKVNVKNMTVSAAEKAVKDALQPDYLVDPSISMEILNYRPFYILGEVRKPGSYDYVSGLTVVEAVALAGGYTYRADKDDVTVVRADDPKNKEREVSQDARIMPGDKIHVPERFF
ncbi:polysaccharide export outer membrane protein [Limimonas halophila]|uniref:Polysaccharide export outer membrane protein n=1 Tax=Limimonas halophila TaxID=1082479 RepID=A0A1G7NLF6_9PROT|nr:polysaccharide biosynthesis/export family protein [Limimonas halophila]SDF74888.1 polysaccharide export outer membrane protein [Limimonas halophila]